MNVQRFAMQPLGAALGRNHVMRITGAAEPAMTFLAAIGIFLIDPPTDFRDVRWNESG
jgi:hypothetical protein